MYTTPWATAGDENGSLPSVPVQFNTMLDWTASLLIVVSELDPVRAGPKRNITQSTGPHAAAVNANAAVRTSRRSRMRLPFRLKGRHARDLRGA
jgi:hypothetical protein